HNQRAKKRHRPVPTVKSEANKTQAELEKAGRSAKEKGDTGQAAAAAAAEHSAPPKSAGSATAASRIRPLSEAKAIDRGATFLSEAFIFTVGAGLILLESFRSRRKESKRRSDVDDRIRDLEAREEVFKLSLIALEKEILELHRQLNVRTGKGRQRILPMALWGVVEQEEGPVVPPWYARAWGYVREASAAVKKKFDGKKVQDDRDSPAAIDKTRRSFWKTLGPSLATTPKLSFKEADLKTHDFEVPFHVATVPPGTGRRHIRFAVVTAQDLKPDYEAATMQKLRHLQRITGGIDVTVIFLSSEDTSNKTNDLDALLSLQRL
ncbi:hypothetical protein KEM54_003105, partial [Ascosphaera aggregata]